MFKLLRNNKGQGIAVQYVLTFFLVIGVVAAMSVYVRRGIQGRIRDARRYMFNTVREVYPSGNLFLGYEPYYIDTVADRGFASTEIRQDLPSSDGGIFQLDVNQATTTRATSQQLPPVNAM